MDLYPGQSSSRHHDSKKLHVAGHPHSGAAPTCFLTSATQYVIGPQRQQRQFYIPEGLGSLYSSRPRAPFQSAICSSTSAAGSAINLTAALIGCRCWWWCFQGRDRRCCSACDSDLPAHAPLDSHSHPYLLSIAFALPGPGLSVLLSTLPTLRRHLALSSFVTRQHARSLPSFPLAQLTPFVCLHPPVLSHSASCHAHPSAVLRVLPGVCPHLPTVFTRSAGFSYETAIARSLEPHLVRPCLPSSAACGERAGRM